MAILPVRLAKTVLGSDIPDVGRQHTDYSAANDKCVLQTVSEYPQAFAVGIRRHSSTEVLANPATNTLISSHQGSLGQVGQPLPLEVSGGCP